MSFSERSFVAQVAVGGSLSARPGVSDFSPSRGADLRAGGPLKDDRGSSSGPAPLWRASVTVHRNEIYVEVEDAAAIELVDRALIHALLEAGTAAEKEGPHVTTAVVPATCYGKVRVSPTSEDFLRTHLESASRAAARVLAAAECEMIER